jgi:hypothetical protein
MMKPTGLGHEKAMSPATACARVESSSRERPGRRETAGCRRGVLSGIVVGGRESRPAGVRTRREYVAHTGSSCRTGRIGSTRANLTAGNSKSGEGEQAPPLSQSLPRGECRAVDALLARSEQGSCQWLKPSAEAMLMLRSHFKAGRNFSISHGTAIRVLLK